MQQVLKHIGRAFFLLTQRDPTEISQTVLVAEGSFILPNNFSLIVKDVKEKFQNAKITALTFEDKAGILKERFPEIEIVTLKSKNKRFNPFVILQTILNKDFDFIVLSALDVIPLFLSLFRSKSRIFLHNRWFEWYQIRLRSIGDILLGVQSTDTQRRKTNYNIKDFLKSFGRIFVVIRHMNDDAGIKTRILISDNGNTPIDHLLTAVRRCEELFVKPDITVITFKMRQQHFRDNFPQINLILAGEKANSFSLAAQICHLRNHRFSLIILTSLDPLPIVASKGFTTVKTLLYNKWHQWWSIELKGIKEYLKGSFGLLLLIPLSIYLMVASGFILLRTLIRSQFLSMKKLWKPT